MNDLSYEYRPLGLPPADAPRGPKAAGARLLDSAPQAAALGLLITTAVFIIDLATFSFNLSIVYSLPMALYARSCRRPASLWRVAAALVFLSYAGYFLGPRADDSPTFTAQLFHFRAVNRTLAAASILAIAAMNHFGIALRRRFDSRWSPRNIRESDRDVFTEVVSSFEQFQAATMSALAVATVAVIDLVTPPHFNPSILYAVPILGCARARSRPFLWVVTLASLLLIRVGFHFGPEIHSDPDLLPKFVRNRHLTEFMVLMMALFVHVWIGIDYPRRRPTSTQPEKEHA